MKVFLMFAASAVSAVLVLPTVTQAQSGSVYEQLAEATDGNQSPQRQG